MHRLQVVVPDGRLLDLGSGGCIIAPGEALTDGLAAEVAGPNGTRLRPGGRGCDPARIREVPACPDGGGPALGHRRSDRDEPDRPGGPVEDARPALRDPDPRRLLPADRRAVDRAAPRVRVPVPPEHAPPSGLDQRRRRCRDLDRPGDRARYLHRPDHPRPDQAARRHRTPCPRASTSRWPSTPRRPACSIPTSRPGRWPGWSARPGSIRARSPSNAPSSRRSATSCPSSARSRPCASWASASRSTTPGPATPAST
jgi:hypothetical protein